MSSLSKVLVLFTLALSVSGLAMPHVARAPHNHRAIAARMATPDAAPAVGPYGDNVKLVKPKKMRKRGDTGRCKGTSSSAGSTFSDSFTSSSAEPTSPVAAVASFSPPSSFSSSTPPPAPQTTWSTSSSSTWSPEPITTWNPPSSSSSSTEAPAATTSTTSSNSGSSESYLSGTQSGQGTYYAIGLGACGITNSGNDRIAAVSKLLFDSYPGYDGTNSNNNPVCGKSITATYQGKTTTVQVTDRCEGCALTDLDFSPAAFQDLADESLGRIDITWVWS